MSHSFKRKGELIYKANKDLENKIFDFAAELGADDIINEDKNYTIYCDPNRIISIKKKISELSIEPISISMTWISSNKVDINKEDGKKLFNLINQLEDNEDVQNISSNFEINEFTFWFLFASFWGFAGFVESSDLEHYGHDKKTEIHRTKTKTWCKCNFSSFHGCM